MTHEEKMQLNEVAERQINIKGNFSRQYFDAKTDRKYSDINYGYGCLVHHGTYREYDELMGYLVKHEGSLGFKII